MRPGEALATVYCASKAAVATAILSEFEYRVLRTRGESQRLVGDVIEKAAGLEEAAGVRREFLEEAGGLGVVRQPAGMIQKVPERDIAPCCRELGESFANGVIQAELLAVDQTQGDSSAERLGNAGDAHMVVGSWAEAGVEVGGSCSVDFRSVAMPQDDDGARGATWRTDQLLQDTAQFVVVWSLLRLRGCAYQSCGHGGGQ